MYNAKNYTEQNGEVTVIGGKLIIEGTLEYAEGADVPSAKAENQVASEAGTIAALKEDFNSLLAKLKAAGLMEADAEPDPEPQPDPEPDPEGEGS